MLHKLTMIDLAIFISSIGTDRHGQTLDQMGQNAVFTLFATHLSLLELLTGSKVLLKLTVLV